MRHVITALAIFATSSLAAQTIFPLQRGVTPNVITVEQVEPAFLIPVVGNADGGFGTQWKSEVVITNHLDRDQRIALTVLPEGASGNGTRTFLTVPRVSAGGFVGLVSSDFMGEHLNRTGLASVLVQAVDGNGNVQSDAQIDGFSRVYTTQPNTSGCDNLTGTLSQPLNVVRPDHLRDVADGMINATRAYIPGMRQDANFRLNIGIVNMSDQSLTWDVDVFGSANEGTFAVTLPPRSMEQLSLIEGNFGMTTLQFTLRNPSPTTTTEWSAYASSVDNRSGDGYTRNAAP